jgi:hypothetical protein
MRFTQTLKVVTVSVIATAALTLGATAAVTAGASGTTHTYFACLKSGALSKVGTASPTCPAGATKISWNSQGPVGAAGPKGAAGPAGAAGATGTQGPAGPTGPSGTTGIFGSANPDSFVAGGAGATCTIGEVALMASTEVADNWLIANGQSLSISTHGALYALIGTNYGGDGVTTFDLPDLTAATPNGLTYAICALGTFP